MLEPRWRPVQVHKQININNICVCSLLLIISVHITYLTHTHMHVHCTLCRVLVVVVVVVVLLFMLLLFSRARIVFLFWRALTHPFGFSSRDWTLYAAAIVRRHVVFVVLFTFVFLFMSRRLIVLCRDVSCTFIFMYTVMYKWNAYRYTLRKVYYTYLHAHTHTVNCFFMCQTCATSPFRHLSTLGIQVLMSNPFDTYRSHILRQ